VPTRIAFCITTLDPGGAERQLVELATRLSRERFEPAVVVLSGPPRPPADVLVERLRQHSLPLTFLGARSVWHTGRAWRGLSHLLRDWRPALVQSFLAHANVLGASAAHRAGVGSIVTGIRTAEQRTNWHRWLQRRTDRFVDRHVCVSQSVAEFARRVMRLPREKLVVIPNSIDAARFAAVTPLPLGELGLPPGRRIILLVARLEPDKRPGWLLERMPQLARRLPQHDVVIAGRGPLDRALRRQAARLGVADRVHFVGWRPDVPRLLAAADVVVLTSAWEGMPNAMLEAMAAARPVVVTEVHGAAEVLGENAAGQLVPANDPPAFVAAVTRLAGDPTLAARLGRRNYERVVREFSVQRMVGSYAELYDSLLGEKTR